MRKNILEATCLLLGLFASLRLCSGKLMTPITDDVSKLSSLKQNVPSDYEIPVSSIPKDVSLRNLAGMFGAVSSNREQISVFISMLKSLRFTFNHEELEAAMQLFQCHYRERGLMSGLYFDYIKDILHAASQGTSGLPCKPPPCLNQHPSPGGQEEGRGSSWSIRAPWILVLIPFTACAVILLWLGKSGRLSPSCNVEDLRLRPFDMIPTVSISVPLQTLPNPADSEPVQDSVREHESS
ncbi:uncharacterized protein LOC130519284 isoform X2 [Takifugu flavidus]|uniref:uncharacterized protein LOC130519284 isoform X2 n=1 Tax=Takifugu flavidus TaxID=433684 RepID=UPI00254448F3|nr:uncharacterized protein LOC130519284 isoform X2 [Takifugu flavidus]